MDRREFMSEGIPFALTAASSEGGAKSSTEPHAEAVPERKPPLFPDNAQFWYETWRVFGAASYGASEFWRSADHWRPHQVWRFRQLV